VILGRSRERLTGSGPFRVGGLIIAIWALAGYTASLVHSVPGDMPLPGRIAFLAAGVLLLAMTVAGLVVRRRGLAWIPWFYTAIVALSLALTLVTIKGPSIIPAYIMIGVTTSNISLRWGAVFTSVAMAGAAIANGLHGGHQDVWAVLGFVGVFFAGLSSREGEVARTAERRNDVLAERATIAREIHDILAHSLSAQVVHLEGARMLLVQDGAREQVLERVERAQRLARSGLEETRRALATLRGDAPAPDEALAALAEEFRAATGRPCDLEIIGPSRDLTPAAGLAVVRTAQEALTNVRKHAPGARAVIRLRYAADGTELEVNDTGGGTVSAPMVEGAGYGLVGMRERAELIGGTLEAGPGKEGFRVFLKVPHE
jgi:signal transduction histidine kinase